MELIGSVTMDDNRVREARRKQNLKTVKEQVRSGGISKRHGEGFRWKECRKR